MDKKVMNEVELKEENLVPVIGGQDEQAGGNNAQISGGESGGRLQSGPCPTCPSRYNCKLSCSFLT